MLDSDMLTQRDKVSSPLLIAALIQAALSLTVIAYCVFGTGHMRPILVELFWQPVIPLGLSVAMFVVASVFWFRRRVRIAMIVVILWCVYDIVARAWLFDGHMSTEQHERRVLCCWHEAVLLANPVCFRWHSDKCLTTALALVTNQRS